LDWEISGYAFEKGFLTVFLNLPVRTNVFPAVAKEQKAISRMYLKIAFVFIFFLLYSSTPFSTDSQTAVPDHDFNGMLNIK
jgi:hypothetical protein